MRKLETPAAATAVALTLMVFALFSVPSAARSQPARTPASASDSATAIALNTQCHSAYQSRQYELALSLCQRSLEMGNSEAGMGLALIYRLGLNQCQRAAPYYVREKDAHPVAAVGLGEMYWLGCPDFPVDYAKARALFQSAASRGYAAGWEDLGWLDELGLGAPHDRQKAIRDFAEASRKGDTWANDVMVALQHTSDSRRFGSPQELGQYAADARLSSALGAYQKDQLNKPKPTDPAPQVYPCVGGGVGIGPGCINPHR